MLWDSPAQSYLDAGGSPTFFVALLLNPIERATGNRVSRNYWTGHETVTLTIGGTNQVLWPSYDALVFENPTFSAGTEIRTTEVQTFGLSDQSVDLLNAYDLNRAPAEIHHLLFTPGMEFKGAKRIWRGEVDEQSLTTEEKGASSYMSISLVSSAREGTRTVTAKKSHESYQRRSGDTAMKYASLREVDTDWWGTRG